MKESHSVPNIYGWAAFSIAQWIMYGGVILSHEGYGQVMEFDGDIWRLHTESPHLRLE